VRRLFPLWRSLTGPGVRETLAIVGERIPLEVHEVPTGTPVFDWTVPREWIPRRATVTDPSGRVVLDSADTNLHVVGYSAPFRGRVPLEVLLEHVHSLPDRPTLVPYRTSYWRETWGLCARHDVVARLEPGDYEVSIDTELRDGALTYGECILRGETEETVLVSTHVCHPSLANDNLSGIAVATFLAAALAARPRRLTYRFAFVPSTIGALTWLSRNVDALPRIRHGLVLAGLGDSGAHTYKRTRDGATIDRAVEHALLTSGRPHAVVDFVPWGYDERQYGAPGIGIPAGLLSRTPHGSYPEYHTSADDQSFVHAESLADSLDLCLEVVEVLERDATYVNVSPMGEPQLGRRGLYGGGTGGIADRELATLWVLNQSDGRHSLLDIAERAGMPFPLIADAADALLGVDLLRPAA
jgi:aminopeptidase-like protein